MEQEKKQPEILLRLELLLDKINNLGEKLKPVSFDLPTECKDVDSKNSSQVMSLISIIASRIDEITDDIDIQ